VKSRGTMAKTQYVDNKKFFEQMVLYNNQVKEADACGDDSPKIPEYIGRCIYDIANRLSHKPNFINYPFREEMIGDGIENAIRALANFDPNKSSNPFAYFTQIIYYAFLRRIAKEKKHLYTKQKAFTSMAILGEVYDEGKSSVDISNHISSMTTDYMNDFVEEYEKSIERKKAPKVKKKKGLELFYDEEEEKV